MSQYIIVDILVIVFLESCSWAPWFVSMEEVCTDAWAFRLIGPEEGVALVEKYSELPHGSVSLFSTTNSQFCAAGPHSLIFGSLSDLQQSLQESKAPETTSVSFEGARQVVGLASQFVVISESKLAVFADSQLQWEESVSISEVKSHPTKAEIAVVASGKIYRIGETVESLGEGSHVALGKDASYAYSNGKLVTLDGNALPELDDEVQYVAFAGSDLFVASKSEDTVLHIWRNEWVEIPELCPPFADRARDLSWYLGDASDWSPDEPTLFVNAFSRSGDLGLASGEHTLMPDDDTAQALLPFADNGDTTPVGASLDWSSSLDVQHPFAGIDRCGPMPVFWILNNEGAILAWNVVSKQVLDKKIPLPNKSKSGVLSKFTLPDSLSSERSEPVDIEQKESLESSDPVSTSSSQESRQGDKSDGFKEIGKNEEAKSSEDSVLASPLVSPSDSENKEGLKKINSMESFTKVSGPKSGTSSSESVKGSQANSSPEPFDLGSLKFSNEKSGQTVEKPAKAAEPQEDEPSKTGGFSFIKPSVFGQTSTGQLKTDFGSAKFNFSSGTDTNSAFYKSAAVSDTASKPPKSLFSSFEKPKAAAESNQTTPNAFASSAFAQNSQTSSPFAKFTSNESSPFSVLKNDKDKPALNASPLESSGDSSKPKEVTPPGSLKGQEPSLSKSQSPIKVLNAASAPWSTKNEVNHTTSTTKPGDGSNTPAFSNSRANTEQTKAPATTNVKKDAESQKLDQVSATTCIKPENERTFRPFRPQGFPDLGDLDSIFAETNSLFQVIDENLYSLGITLNSQTKSKSPSDDQDASFDQTDKIVSRLSDLRSQVGTLSVDSSVLDSLSDLAKDCNQAHHDIMVLAKIIASIDKESETKASTDAYSPMPWKASQLQHTLKIKFSKIRLQIQELEEKLMILRIRGGNAPTVNDINIVIDMVGANITRVIERYSDIWNHRIDLNSIESGVNNLALTQSEGFDQNRFIENVEASKRASRIAKLLRSRNANEVVV